MTQSTHISPQDMAKYRSTFRQQERLHIAEREARRKQAQLAVRSAVEATMPHYPSIKRVYLFGSVIGSGIFRANSDIDIGLEGTKATFHFDVWRDLEKIIKDWMLDVRFLDPEDPFSERVRQKGELIYECQTTDS